MSAPTTLDAEVLATRRRRFNDVLDGYECGAGDWAMPTTPVIRDAAMRELPAERVAVEGPAAARYVPGRYAVVCESTRGHGYHVTNVTDRSEIEPAARASIRESWEPVCYFDLDVLAGDEPMPNEGDIVAYANECHDDCRHPNLDHAAAGEPCQTSDGVQLDWPPRYFVLRLDEELSEGEIAYYLILNRVGSTHTDAWDDWDERVYWDEVTLVERAEPDERMPVRYGVARITTTVAFNTVPTP